MKTGEQRRLAVLSSPSEVRLLAQFCTSAIAGIFSEEEVASIELAIVEAANNIVEHAYNFEEGHPIQLSLSHRGDCLELLFFDKGPAFEHSRIAKPDFLWENVDDIPEGGWGVYLINSIMDSVEFDRQGNINILKMIKKFSSDKFDGNLVSFEKLKNTGLKENEIARLRKLLQENEIAINEMAEELSYAYESLNLFYSLSRDVALISNLNEFLQNTLERVLTVAGANWGVVRLKRDDKLILYAQTDACPQEVMHQELFLRDSLDIESKVAMSLKEEIQDSYASLNFRVLCLPIVGLDEFLGTILLGKNKDKDGFSSGDLKLTRAIADQIAVSIENGRLYSQAMDAELDKQDMKIATDLQKKLIIQKLPDINGLRFFTKTEPAKQVGGDYLALEKISDDTVIFVLCDAMGKGMSASYFSLLSHMAVHSILLQQNPKEITPGRLLSLVNKVMFRDFDLFGMFMTGFVGKIELNNNCLSYASAGHCQPILYSKNGIALLDTLDFMMGVDEEIEYTDFYVDFKPDTKLLIYSDGLTDITDSAGDIVGVEPLVKLCMKEFASKDIIGACESIYTEIVKISGDSLQDDISMIGIEHFK
jgi:serine phosphatase RsbU (regulator of sigma subunit)/anti-sigma regulatory factor (Ser/Thr protein kinase)